MKQSSQPVRKDLVLDESRLFLRTLNIEGHGYILWALGQPARKPRRCFKRQPELLKACSANVLCTVIDGFQGRPSQLRQ
jgi:hypothetical protein